MCQYAVNDHGVNLPPVLFKLSMSWILVDFLGRISATPPKSLPNECEEYFLLVVTEAVSIATWANGSRHDFFWTWGLPFFFGGGLVGDELKPEMLFPLIFVWTWSMRCLVGCFCHKHLCFFARRIEMHMNHTGSLNSNSQWNFMVSILIPGDVCCFCWRTMIKPTM